MDLAILNLDTIKDIYNGAVMEAFQEHQDEEPGHRAGVQS